jgi:pimeloyl-ACP methyl ester carboxylesterase
MSAETAPEWFRQAVANAGQSHFVDIDGVAVHYLAWNLDDTSKPGLLFVHGYRGHARWWDFIAPFFADRYRVVALDLSGMGDSGHRAHYDAKVFAADINGVIEHAGLGPATVVGHSLGGARVMRACSDAPHLFRHLIIVDSYMRFGGENFTPPPPPRATAPYADRASALQRFRLMPPQAVTQPYVMDYIAAHSLREVEGGWSWKFDRDLPVVILEDNEAQTFSGIKLPIDVVRGEHSAVVPAVMAQRMAALFSSVRGPIVIPDGYHHVMVSQPLALIGTINALLA